MPPLTRQQRARDAVKHLAAVSIGSKADFTVSSQFLDSPLAVNVQDEKPVSSTPVDQIIPEWAWSPESEPSSTSTSSNFSSFASSFNRSLASSSPISPCTPPSDYATKHGQYTSHPGIGLTRKPHADIFVAPFANFRISTPRADVTPASCLQCTLLKVPCSQTHPTCTRCLRRHEEPLGGCYGLLRAVEPCLAQRKQRPDETIHAPSSGLVDVLFRLEEDGEGDWERKLELANDLIGKERERVERENWVLPEAPKRFVEFGFWEGDDVEMSGCD